MACCCQYLKNLRHFFSLRVGIACLCSIYLFYLSVELITGRTPLILNMVNHYVNVNMMSMSTLYYAAGITVLILAWIGVLLVRSRRDLRFGKCKESGGFICICFICANCFICHLNEKSFIVPLITYDGSVFVLHVACVIYAAFVPSEKLVLITFFKSIALHYFALILEYNFYQQLAKKSKFNQIGQIESLIILPPETGNGVDPEAILQRYIESHQSGKYLHRCPLEPMHQIRHQQVAGPSNQQSAFTIPVVYFSMDSEAAAEAPPPYSP